MTAAAMLAQPGVVLLAGSPSAGRAAAWDLARRVLFSPERVPVLWADGHVSSDRRRCFETELARAGLSSVEFAAAPLEVLVGADLASVRARVDRWAERSGPGALFVLDTLGTHASAMTSDVALSKLRAQARGLGITAVILADRDLDTLTPHADRVLELEGGA